MDKNIKNILEKGTEEEKLLALDEILSENKIEFSPYLMKIISNDESQIVRETAVDILKKFDISDYYNELSELFLSSDAYVRNAAIEIFGEQGEKAVPFLISIMDHKNPEVRKLILDSMVATGSKYAYPAIEAAIKDPAINVKITAIEYVGILENRKLKEEILKIFIKDDEPMVKAACLETLLKIGDSEVLNKILGFLKPEIKEIEPLYKPFVFRMIGYFGEETHMNILFKYLNYKNLTYINDILDALNKLSDKFGVKGFTNENVSFLKKAVFDEENSDALKMEALKILLKADFEKKDDFINRVREKVQSEDIKRFLEGREIISPSEKESIKPELKKKTAKKKKRLLSE